MRSSDQFAFSRAGCLVGTVEVQDTGEFDAVEGLAPIVQAAAAATWPKAAVYTGAPRPWVVAVRLGGEEEGQTLNREFRKKDYVPNVLSFPAAMPEEDDGYGDEDFMVGDLYITIPVVQREAAEQNKPLPHHLAHMVVHGLLHLAGYDHETGPEDAARMEALEVEILAEMDIPNPYEGEGDEIMKEKQ